MNLKCLSYRALERVRFSALGARLFYGGQRVELQGPITIRGVVIRAASPEVDGDCTFDVRVDDVAIFHCEVTPCQPAAVRTIARSLQVGWRVSVSGTKRWDPAHLGSHGHQEIHPVATILRILS